MSSKDLKFKVRQVSSQKEVIAFEKFIDEDWEENPFYCYDYLFHDQDTSHSLLVFELWRGQQCLALLPVIKRPIVDFVQLDQGYNDVISPYGYSGPLFRQGLGSDDRKLFWKYIDQWYKQNKVISEFIRFSLDGNEKDYSGKLQKTLHNVCGSILSDQDQQWDQFHRKVRNNYRKAQKSNVQFKAFTGDDLNTEYIEKFYEIYIETMQRNEASRYFFMPIDYFNKLLLSRPNKFALAFSIYNDQYISTELLIIHDENIFAFLGGTKQEYFQFRPNDYLRVNIIKWASQLGLSNYVLGGGRIDKDSLYKHKKSLFPKSEDKIFYTGRKIIFPELYEQLVREKHQSIGQDKIIEDNFFPEYRIFPTDQDPLDYEVARDKKQWKKVLSAFSDYDVYHEFDYYEANRNKEERSLLFCYSWSNIKIAIPLIVRPIPNTKYFDATTAYGYGGPISRGITRNYNTNSFEQAFRDFLGEENIISVFGRLHPFIPNQKHLLQNLGTTEYRGKVIYIDLQNSEEDIVKGYQNRNRTQINKFKKVCTVYISNSQSSVDEFISIYNENMDRVGASPEYYFDREYYSELLNSPDIKTDFLFVRENDTETIVGAGILFKKNQYTQYHLSGARTEGLHLSPAKLLIDHMWRISKQEGYRYFNLGGGLGAQEDNLFRFKSLFSDSRRPFYIWKYIVDQKIYDELVNSISSIQKKDFFPLYRG